MMELSYENRSLKKKRKDQQSTIPAGFTQILILPTLGFGVQSSNLAFKANVLASACVT